jgi:DNA mismatch repair protein MutS
MDEIGRGTSTFDGLSLAWASARHLATKLHAFTLFATHYFELTTLPETLPHCCNVHLDAVEHGEAIIFMHSVKEGPANQSYGLQVAQLAGVPREVVQQAKLKLFELEQGSVEHREHAAGVAQLPLFVSTPPHPLLEAVALLEPDELSPREALQALYKLKDLL